MWEQALPGGGTTRSISLLVSKTFHQAEATSSPRASASCMPQRRQRAQLYHHLLLMSPVMGGHPQGSPASGPGSSSPSVTQATLRWDSQAEGGCKSRKLLLPPATTLSSATCRADSGPQNTGLVTGLSATRSATPRHTINTSYLGSLAASSLATTRDKTTYGSPA